MQQQVRPRAARAGQLRSQAGKQLRPADVCVRRASGAPRRGARASSCGCSCGGAHHSRGWSKRAMRAATSASCSATCGESSAAASASTASRSAPFSASGTPLQMMPRQRGGARAGAGAGARAQTHARGGVAARPPLPVDRVFERHGGQEAHAGVHAGARGHDLLRGARGARRRAARSGGGMHAGCCAQAGTQRAASAARARAAP